MSFENVVVFLIILPFCYFVRFKHSACLCRKGDTPHSMILFYKLRVYSTLNWKVVIVFVCIYQKLDLRCVSKPFSIFKSVYSGGKKSGTLF